MDVKFRGRIKNQDEQVCGYLIDNNRIYQQNERSKSKHCDYGIYIVDEETIGKNSGLKDKNGEYISR